MTQAIYKSYQHLLPAKILDEVKANVSEKLTEAKLKQVLDAVVVEPEA